MLKKKPASLAERPASKSGQDNNNQHRLDNEASSPSPERNANISPAAELRDARWHDADLAFFAEHGITCRVRLPYQTEFEPDVISTIGRTLMIRVVLKHTPITHVLRNAFHVEAGNA
jgi:hypothetical protein